MSSDEKQSGLGIQTFGVRCLESILIQAIIVFLNWERVDQEEVGYSYLICATLDEEYSAYKGSKAGNWYWKSMKLEISSRVSYYQSFVTPNWGLVATDMDLLKRPI